MNKVSIPKITIYHLIKDLINTDKKKAVFEIGNKKITREKLYQDILNTQNYLIKFKLNEKDTVVSMLENSYEQITFFLPVLIKSFIRLYIVILEILTLFTLIYFFSKKFFDPDCGSPSLKDFL